MLIADAQVHLWGASTSERPRVEGEQADREAPFGADELLHKMDVAGVHRAAVVPRSFDGDRNDVVLEAARLHPDRFAAIGRLDTAAMARSDTKASGARDTIANWRRHPDLLGLRCGFKRPQTAPALTEGRAQWLWDEVEKAGVPIMVMVSHATVHLIDRVAERHPGLKLALCHFALPTDKQDADAFRDLDQLLAIAKRPNVAVKASALPCYTNDAYPYRRLHPYIKRVYDAFGPQRMFWGSDLSRLPRSCSYHQAVTMFTEEIPWFTAEDKEWIMGRGLCEWLGWKIP